MPTYRPAPATECCAAALARGPLVRVGNSRMWWWTTGRRSYSRITVNSLIASGAAVLDGTVVRAADRTP